MSNKKDSEEIVKAKLGLIWDMVQNWQDAIEEGDDINEPKFSHQDIEIDLYDWMEKVDPEVTHEKPSPEAIAAPVQPSKFSEQYEQGWLDCTRVWLKTHERVKEIATAFGEPKYTQDDMDWANEQIASLKKQLEGRKIPEEDLYHWEPLKPNNLPGAGRFITKHVGDGESAWGWFIFTGKKDLDLQMIEQYQPTHWLRKLK